MAEAKAASSFSTASEEMDKLKAELTQRTDALREVEAHRDKLKLIHDEDTVRKEALNEEHRELRDQFSMMRREKMELETKLHLVESDLRNTTNQFEKELQEREKQIYEINNVLDEKRSSLKSALHDVEAAREETAAAHKELMLEKRKGLAAVSDYEKLQQLRSDDQKQIVRYVENISDLDERYGKLLREKSGLEDKLHDALATVREFEAERKVLLSKVEQFEANEKQAAGLDQDFDLSSDEA